MPKSASLASDPTEARPRAFQAVQRAVIPVAQEMGMTVIQSVDTLTVGRFHMTATALTIPDDITSEEWAKLGFLFYRLKTSLKWWIGDWINNYNAKWGDTYTDARKLTRLGQKTLRNIASITGNVDVSLRRDKLSFAHHAVIAYLSPNEQCHWLNRAETERLSVHRLEALIKGDDSSLDKQRREAVAMLKTAFTNVVGQYLTGEGYSSRVLQDMRLIIDAMERHAPVDEIVQMLRS